MNAKKREKERKRHTHKHTHAHTQHNKYWSGLRAGRGEARKIINLICNPRGSEREEAGGGVRRIFALTTDVLFSF